MASADVAKRFVERINAHDVSGLVALMTSDHVFIDSLGNKLARPSIEDGWRRYFDVVPDYWVRIDSMFSEGSIAILVGAAGGTYISEDEAARPENKWQTPAVWVARIEGQGVAEWRVYSDNEPIREKMRRSKPRTSQSRPFSVVVEQKLEAPPSAIYRAWTKQFDRWFAAPGTVLMLAKVNTPFFFETQFKGEGMKSERHPHYGRFLKLRRNNLVKMTWVTGPEGTEGAETVVTLELSPSGKGTKVRLTHVGFPNERSKVQHEKAWPTVLRHLDETLTRTSKD